MEEWAINGNCDNCRQFGCAWRYCPHLDEAGKAALAQRKGQPDVKRLPERKLWDGRSLERADLDKWELWRGWKRVPDTSMEPKPVRKRVRQAEGVERAE